MEIIRAKTAGFCFGVDRAVKLTYDLLAQGRKVATLGPLIHNAQVVADLEAKGAVTCPDIDAVPDGYEVIIRAGHSALRLQVGHDLGVVDQWAEGRNLASLRQ